MSKFPFPLTGNSQDRGDRSRCKRKHPYLNPCPSRRRRWHLQQTARSPVPYFPILQRGRGRRRMQHDIASSNKVRGEGIGFAGVGIKLGLLICEEVLTETQRGKSHVASLWHMASRHRAPWKWVPCAGRVHQRGTAVRLKLRNPLSPLLDPGYLEATLRRHFRPLLDPAFNDFLTPHYPNGIAIDVNQQRLAKQRSMATR